MPPALKKQRPVLGPYTTIESDTSTHSHTRTLRSTSKVMAHSILRHFGWVCVVDQLKGRDLDTNDKRYCDLVFRDRHFDGDGGRHCDEDARDLVMRCAVMLGLIDD